MDVGIIGFGIVGSAIAANCYNCNLHIYDKFKTKLNTGVVGCTQLCFICVPTPTTDGMQDLTQIRDALNYLTTNDFQGIAVIKSTILPGTMDRLRSKYSIPMVHNPEFLTERNAAIDFRDQKVALISGDKKHTQVLSQFYKNILPQVSCLEVRDYRITELAKYIHNAALAVKLSFLNEIYELANDQATFDLAVNMAISQGMIGESHTQVPGPDGKRGFGGMCLPKDSKALLKYAHNQGKAMPTLCGALETNLRVRQDK